MWNPTNFPELTEQQRLLRRQLMLRNSTYQQNNAVMLSRDLADTINYHPDLYAAGAINGLGFPLRGQTMYGNNSGIPAAAGVVAGSGRTAPLGARFETPTDPLNQYYDQRYRQMLFRQQMFLSLELQELNQEILSFSRQQRERELRGNIQYPGEVQTNLAGIQAARFSLENETRNRHIGNATRSIEHAQLSKASSSHTFQVAARVDTGNTQGPRSQDKRADEHVQRFRQRKTVDCEENFVESALEAAGNKSKPSLKAQTSVESPNPVVAGDDDNKSSSVKTEKEGLKNYSKVTTLDANNRSECFDSNEAMPNETVAGSVRMHGASISNSSQVSCNEQKKVKERRKAEAITGNDRFGNVATKKRRRIGNDNVECEELHHQLKKKPKHIAAEEYWTSMLNELKSYKIEHGNCRVPRSYGKNPKLGGWVAEQRKQYILKERGRQSAITDQRIELLNDIDFEWNAQQAAWDCQFQYMQEFYKQQGHCIVPRNDPKYSKLTSWIQEQRRHYSLLQRGQPSRLTPKRLDALNAIGFCWDASTETWTKRFHELVKFKEQHGHCLVPTTIHDSNNKTKSTKLGVWVCHLRYQYKQYKDGETNHHLTEDRIRALNEIGFVWKVRNKKNRSYNNDSQAEVQQNNNFKAAASSCSSEDGNTEAHNDANLSVSSSLSVQSAGDSIEKISREEIRKNEAAP